MESAFLRQAILSFIRYAAAPLIAWISVKFGITEDVTTAFIVGGVTYGLMFIWSLANKWRTETKIETALELPGGSSRERLNAVIKNS